MLQNQQKNIEVLGWDKEIIEFCNIMLELEDTFASAKPIHPDHFEPAALQIKKLKTLVDNSLTREISLDKKVTTKFWQGVKFQYTSLRNFDDPCCFKYFDRTSPRHFRGKLTSFAKVEKKKKT